MENGYDYTAKSHDWKKDLRKMGDLTEKEKYDLFIDKSKEFEAKAKK